MLAALALALALASALAQTVGLRFPFGLTSTPRKLGGLPSDMGGGGYLLCCHGILPRRRSSLHPNL